MKILVLSDLGVLLFMEEIFKDIEGFDRSVKKTSKYTGVSWSKQSKKWHARININGKDKHLGYFDIELSAALSYQRELTKLDLEDNYFDIEKFIKELKLKRLRTL